MVQKLAGDVRIADTTFAVPHPYPVGAAEKWIAGHPEAYETRREIIFAVELAADRTLVGAASLLDFRSKDARAELGYWTGVPYWGNGYCTEAVKRLMSYATEALDVSRVVGRCLARNAASARVMVKAGLKPEGQLVQHVRKNGVFEDVLLFGFVLPSRGNA